MEIVLVPMVPADVATLTPIMTRAFDDDTRDIAKSCGLGSGG